MTSISGPSTAGIVARRSDQPCLITLHAHGEFDRGNRGLLTGAVRATGIVARVLDIAASPALMGGVHAETRCVIAMLRR